MTTLERVASIFALLQGSGLEITAQQQPDGVWVRLATSCGKETRFSLSLTASPEKVAQGFGYALERLAHQRHLDLLTPKGTS